MTQISSNNKVEQQNKHYKQIHDSVALTQIGAQITKSAHRTRLRLIHSEREQKASKHITFPY